MTRRCWRRSCRRPCPLSPRTSRRRLARPRWRPLAAAVADEVTTQTRPAPLGPLAQLRAVETLGPETALSLRRGLRCRITRRGGELQLRLLDRTIELATTAENAVKAVLTGELLTPAVVARAGCGRAARTRAAIAARGRARAGLSAWRRSGRMAATRVIRVHASRSIDVPCTPNCAATRCSAPRSRPAGSCSSSNPDRGAEPACPPPGSTAAAAAALVARAAERGIRVLAIRRPGRTPRRIVRRWALIDCRSGRESARWGSYESDAELLELPLDGSAGEPTQQLAYLVCTHSKHDTCCALRGRHVAAGAARGPAWVGVGVQPRRR